MSHIDYKEIITYKDKTDIILRCITVGFGGFMYGYNLSELTILSGGLNIVYQIKESQLFLFQTIMVASMSFGAFLISLISDALMRRLGRRKYMMLSDVIFIVGACVGMVQQVYVLVIARFIMGIAIGMNSNVVSMYIREVSPDSISGFTGSIFQIQINLGIISGIALSILCKFGSQYIQLNQCPQDERNYSDNEQCQDKNGLWRLVILFPIIFSIIRLLFLGLKYKLDTPYYYYSMEKFEEGLKVLNEIYQDNYVDIVSENIIESLPKKIRVSFTNYTRYKMGQNFNSQQSIDKNDQNHNDLQQQQYMSDFTDNSNLNYESEDDCFHDQNQQFPLEGADLRSESQLNYNFIEQQGDNSESFTQKAQELKKKSLRKRKALGFSLNFLQQLTGINVVIQYTANVIKVIGGQQQQYDQHYDEKNNIISYVTLLSNIYLLFAAVIGSTLNRQFGRKNFLIGGYAIQGFLHLILGIMSRSSSSDSTLMQILTIVFVFTFYGTFNCSVGPVTWIYTSDILKGKDFSMSVAMNWLGVTCASGLNFLYQENNTIYINFFIFSSFCIIGGFVCKRYVIETEGKSYIEIIREYSK